MSKILKNFSSRSARFLSTLVGLRKLWRTIAPDARKAVTMKPRHIRRQQLATPSSSIDFIGYYPSLVVHHKKNAAGGFEGKCYCVAPIKGKATVAFDLTVRKLILGDLDAGEDYFWSGRRDRGGGFDYLRDGSRGRQAPSSSPQEQGRQAQLRRQKWLPLELGREEPTRSRRTCPGRTCPGLAGSTDRWSQVRAFAGRLATEALERFGGLRADFPG
ncbi:MAG: hypothetical protein WAK03_15280 [Methylocystis sp.]